MNFHNQTINEFFARFAKSNQDVIKVKCCFPGFLFEHNISKSLADHCGSLFTKLFPDCCEKIWQWTDKNWLSIY